jgi:hypothetical protein
MLPSENIIAEATRIEQDEASGKLYIVFEITNEQYRKYILENWMNDIEFKLINKGLVKND